MKTISIKDLYAGKPDAKDEIDFEGLSEFIKTFVVPDPSNIENLLYGNYYFITGYKGTGKTALLFYLDSYLHDKDDSASTSFIFFKSDFTDSKRRELENISKRLLSSILIDNSTMLHNTDFEYVWRWIFFKKIISDNDRYNGGLFEDDGSWTDFVDTVERIKSPIDQRKGIIPSKLKLAIPYTDPTTNVKVSPELEVDLQNLTSNNGNYSKFVELIDLAEKKFLQIRRTDIPYYIFIDELEAYYGDETVFKRDLYLIRDLIFTVKKFNSIFALAKMENTKIVCSVRSEIINAINRFIVTKELNKVVSGFEIPLIWDYSTTNSYAHPIIRIILKRIAVCMDENEFDELGIYRKWFPEKIHDIEPANYILNNTWHKPRDIVRLLISAQNCIKRDEHVFSQAVFSSLTKRYSIESLTEIKEEMRALYTSAQIDEIISCFVGYKTVFSVKQLQDRIDEYFCETILKSNFSQIINDLYRLGFLGNYFPPSQTYRWQHKGDDKVILSDEWRLMVHYALHSALSIGKKQDYGYNRNEDPQIGDTALAVVTKVIPSFVLVSFTFCKNKYCGQIHIGEFGKKEKRYISDLKKVVSIGDEFRVVLKEYNDKYESWLLSLSEEEK